MRCLIEFKKVPIIAFTLFVIFYSPLIAAPAQNPPPPQAQGKGENEENVAGPNNAYEYNLYDRQQNKRDQQQRQQYYYQSQDQQNGNQQPQYQRKRAERTQYFNPLDE